MKTVLKLSLQYLQEQEFDSSVIPPDVVERLKASGDSNPEFRVYCVSHEGDVKGKIVGKGSVATRYARDIITKLNDTLKAGVKAFMGHGKDNSHEGRETIGEVVASFVKEVGGKLNQFAAVYIKPAYRQLKLDVASLETDVQCEYDGSGTFNVMDVEPITGLALGDSAKDSPGFKNATLRAQVQYFLDENKETGMTLEELKAAIREGRFKPSDLFTKKDLQGDEVVDTLMKSHSQKEFEHRTSVQEKLDTVTKELETVKASFESVSGAHKELSSKMSKTLVKEHSSALVKENKYNDKMAKFIEAELESFDPGEFKDEKSLKAILGEQVTKLADKYKTVAEILGVKLDDNKTPVAGDDNPDSGSVDYTDPKQNDFIG